MPLEDKYHVINVKPIKKNVQTFGYVNLVISADQDILTKKLILILIISTIVAKMTAICLVRPQQLSEYVPMPQWYLLRITWTLEQTILSFSQDRIVYNTVLKFSHSMS